MSEITENKLLKKGDLRFLPNFLWFILCISYLTSFTYKFFFGGKDVIFRGCSQCRIHAVVLVAHNCLIPKKVFLLKHKY